MPNLRRVLVGGSRGNANLTAVVASILLVLAERDAGRSRGTSQGELHRVVRSHERTRPRARSPAAGPSEGEGPRTRDPTRARHGRRADRADDCDGLVPGRRSASGRGVSRVRARRALAGSRQHRTPQSIASRCGASR